MKIIQFTASALLILFFGNSYANNKTEHYVFHYETGDTYDVVLTDNTITWTGLEGSDTGRSETDVIKRKTLNHNTEVLQWTENDLTFMTVVLDHRHLKVIASGKLVDNSWLSYGRGEKK